MLIEITKVDVRRLAQLCDDAARYCHAKSYETRRTVPWQARFVQARRLQTELEHAVRYKGEEPAVVSTGKDGE